MTQKSNQNELIPESETVVPTKVVYRKGTNIPLQGVPKPPQVKVLYELATFSKGRGFGSSKTIQGFAWDERLAKAIANQQRCSWTLLWVLEINGNFHVVGRRPIDTRLIFEEEKNEKSKNT